jgi:uncharacterized protein DUF262/uncharacterized protein DUF1524
MKPATHTVNELFERDVRYVVPLYQRPYVWDEEDQWEPLWDDIHVLLDHQVNGEVVGDSPWSHFLGAIVLEQETQAPGAIPVYTLIDGQQRLTTLQLLLAAAANVARARSAEDAADLLSELVRNNEKKVKGDALFKVWPTNSNRAAFGAVMRPGGPLPDREDDPHNRIDEAYAYFGRRIDEWLDEDDPDDRSVEERLGILRVTLGDLLKLVSITLEPGDNAQVIFETLNARGTPLLALDLVKNAMFQEAFRQGQDVDGLYEGRWKPVLDDDYWRIERRQGRLKRPQGELFLMHWLGMRLRRVIPATELFAVFRKEILAGPPPPATDTLIAELCRDARILRGFDHLTETTPEGRFFRRLEALDTTTVLPLVLFLFREPRVGEAARRRALAALESWLVRRALMRLTAQNYNVQVPAMLTKVAVRPEQADEAIIDHLRTATGQISRWPSDAELLRFLTSQGVYGVVSQKRLVMALGAVEESLHTSKVDLLGLPGDLSIEHVMPQRWQAHWPLDPGIAGDPDAEVARNQRVHRLGNLTLTSFPLNAALSNDAWPRKRVALNRHTRLLLNVELLERYGDRFDEAAIDERTERLAQAICRIWPGPEGPVWVPESGVERSVGAPPAPGAAGEPLELAPVRLPPPEPISPPAAPLHVPVAPNARVSSEGAPPVPRGPQGVYHPAPRVRREIAERIVRARHEEARLPQEIGRTFDLTSGQVEVILWEWEPEIFPHTGLAATPEDVAAARDGLLPSDRLIAGEHPALRWDRIATRAGITPEEARRLYEIARGSGAARRSYTGRGRRFADME